MTYSYKGHKKRWRHVLLQRLSDKCPTLLMRAYVWNHGSVQIRSLRGTNSKLVKLTISPDPKTELVFEESTKGFPSRKLITQLLLVCPS